jgi:hypothetical protein
MTRRLIESEGRPRGWTVASSYPRGQRDAGSYVTYRRGDFTIRVEYGPRNEVLWCALYADGEMHPRAERYPSDKKNTDTIIEWMRRDR